MALLDGIAQYLANQGHGTYTPDAAGGSIFLEKMPQAPDVATAIYAYGGGEADTKLGYDEPSVQIRTRAGPDPRVSRAAARSILEKLHGVGRLTLPDGTVVIDMIAIQSEPIGLGPDENGRHEHTINLRVETRNTNNGRE